MQFCVLLTVALGLISVEYLPAVESQTAAFHFLASLIVQAAVCLMSAVMAMRLQPNSGHSERSADLERRLSRTVFLHTVGWALCSIASFLWLPWTSGLLGTSQDWSLIARPLTLLPAVASFSVSWFFWFDVESSLSSVSTQGGTVGISVQRKGQFDRLVYVFKQSTRFLAVPGLLLVGMVCWSDLVSLYMPGHQDSVAGTLARCVPLIPMAVLLPQVLRWTMTSKSLPSGRLRDAVNRLCEETGTRMSDVMVWDTQLSMRNAAVTGLVPGLRYLFLSDRLIRDVPARRIELLVLHELGHVRHAHSLKLLLMSCLLGSLGSVSYLIGVASVGFYPAIVVSVASCWISAIGFGRLSRLYELQADLWAARFSGDTTEYLRSLADLGGRPDRGGWLHPSFEKRCEFLLNGIEKAGGKLRSDILRVLLCLLVWVCAVPGSLMLVARGG
jgi:Zn-dependent protease with chaperone function